MIIDSSALTEQVIDDAIESGFNSAGQRCSALRILAIQDEVYDKTIKMLIGATKKIKVGKVEIGQKVSIKVAAYRDKEFIGTVSKIEPKAYIQQNVTTFPVLIDINNEENLLLIGMNTDVVIEILKKDVVLSVPTMSLRTRKDIYTATSVLNIDKEGIDIFLKEKVEGENFNRFIVIKDSGNGPYLSWVKVGISDLYNVEIIEGLTKDDIVYILPSKSLFDYQERFKERVSGSFSFG